MNLMQALTYYSNGNLRLRTREPGLDITVRASGEITMASGPSRAAFWLSDFHRNDWEVVSGGVKPDDDLEARRQKQGTSQRVAGAMKTKSHGVVSHKGGPWTDGDPRNPALSQAHSVKGEGFK